MEKPVGFKQVMVWPGAMLGKDSPEKFEQEMEEHFGIKIKFIETLLIPTDKLPEEAKPEDGEQAHALIFYVHDDTDPLSFTMLKMTGGIVELEAAMEDLPEIFPENYKEYCIVEEAE